MMKYGVALPYIGARAAAQMAQLAEEAGWDGIFMGDAIWCEDPMICLTAAAMVTKRIRLGPLVTPVPLRRPWKLASESVALDRLSDGRLILGLATGAVWMGWQAFPDEITDNKMRAGMLDETIDILTLFDRRKPFDYQGKHYHLTLTQLDEQYYPPKPVQQPRVPLWSVGIWPVKKSMQRVLKCDGVIVEKKSVGGKVEEITAGDIQEIYAFIQTNRTMTEPFDIVMVGNTHGLSLSECQDKLIPLFEAGLTWWIEGLWEEAEDTALQRIGNGPPLRKVA